MTQCNVEIQKLTRCVLSIQNLTPNKIFYSKSYFLKKHGNCKICRFHEVNKTKRDVLNANMCSKSNMPKHYQIKIRHFVLFSVQSLMRCKTFIPKSDA